MPLARTTLPIRFQGLDTKTDDASVPASKLVRLENGVFSKLGRVGKRDGGTAIPQSFFLGNPPNAFMAAFRDMPILCLSGRGDAARATGNTLSSLSLRLWPADVRKRAAMRSTYACASPDVALDPTTGVRFYGAAATRSGVTYLALVARSRVGLQTYSVSSAMAAITRPRVLAIGGGFVSLVATTALHASPDRVVGRAYRVDEAGAIESSWTDNTLSAALASANRVYDACVLTSGGQSRVFVAYGTATGTVELKAFSVDLVTETFTQQGATVTIAATAPTALALDPYIKKDGSAHLALAYFAGGNVTLRRYSFALALEKGPFNLGAASNVTNLVTYPYDGSTPDHTSFTYWTERSSPTALPRVRVSQVSADATFAPTTAHEGLALASKAIAPPDGSTGFDRRHSLLLLSYEACGGIQPTYLLWDPWNLSWLAKFHYGYAGGIAPGDMLCGVPAETASRFLLPILGKNRVASAAVGPISVTWDAAVESGVDEVAVDFDCRPVTCVLGDSLLVSGGVPGVWEGGQESGPLGFLLGPEIISVEDTALYGTGAGSVQFVAVYEYVDANGHTVQSVPSVPASITTAATGGSPAGWQVTLRRPVALPDARFAGVAIYRTEVNGTVFYRATMSTVPAPTGSTLAVHSGFLTDDELVGQRQLYTTGGAIENVWPGAISFLATVGNRAWAIDAADRLLLWYSREVLSDAPVEFSDAFTFRLAPRADDPNGATALAKLDEKVVVFSERGISYIIGQGPDATGGQNDLREVQLPAEVGCVDPRSVVTTGAGVFFKSARGIYLLDRSLQTSYVGADVEAWNGTAIVQARALPTTTTVVFFLEGGGALAYDYLVGQWSTWDEDVEALDACVAGGRLYWLRASDGYIVRQEPGQKWGPAFIPLVLETGWLNLAGIAGFARLYELHFLGERLGASTLRVDLAFDFEAEPTQTVTVDPVTCLEEGSTRFRIEVALKRQKCSAVKITVTELEPVSASSGGVALTAMSAVVGVKGTAEKLPRRQRVG